MANSWGSVQLAPTLMGTTVMDGAEPHVPPPPSLHDFALPDTVSPPVMDNKYTHAHHMALSLVNRLVHFFQHQITGCDYLVLKKVQVEICAMWLFSTVTFF